MKQKFRIIAFAAAFALVVSLFTSGDMGQGGTPAENMMDQGVVSSSGGANASTENAKAATNDVSDVASIYSKNSDLSHNDRMDEKAATHDQGSSKKTSKNAKKIRAVSAVEKREITAKTVEPKPNQKHEGYIVIANRDVGEDANNAGYSASSAGDYIRVDSPIEALEFTDSEYVDMIVPNTMVTMEAYPYTTNDTHWNSQWNLYPYNTTMDVTTSHGIDVSALYVKGLDGNGVKVGVFDTGLGSSSIQHPDLRKNFTAAHGINFATMAGEFPTSGVPPQDAYDLMTHGTAVAGFIAATTNNSTGIAGVASKAEIYPYRIFNKSDTPLYVVLYGLEYLLDHNALPDVINMSIGTDIDEQISKKLEGLFNEVAAKGTIVVAAAGNSGSIIGTRDYLSYPASFNSVISVANSQQSGNLAGGSQENSKVDVTAPGSSVYSLKPDGTSGYVGSGTSFSSPLVAGIAAALKQKDKTIDVYAFRELIKKTSRKVRVGTSAFPYDEKGHSDSYGYGFIDAGAMLRYIEQPGLYRIDYDLDGGNFDKSVAPPIYVTSGAFSSEIALPGTSGSSASAPVKSGYSFLGWTIDGVSPINKLTSSNRPAIERGHVKVKARYGVQAKLVVSDFSIPVNTLLSLENDDSQNGAAGHARYVAELALYAGAQTNPSDPIVDAQVEAVDYITKINASGGTYIVEFSTQSGAFATVAMTVYDSPNGMAAVTSPTGYNSMNSTSTPGASVVAKNFAVNLSAVESANPISLAKAAATKWQRSGTYVKSVSADGIIVTGFSSITTGGTHTVYFSAASSPNTRLARTVTVTDDLPRPDKCEVRYYNENGAYMFSDKPAYGSAFYDYQMSPRAGYTFSGWNTRLDGTGAYYTSATPVTKDISVYPIWIKQQDNPSPDKDKSGENATDVKSQGVHVAQLRIPVSSIHMKKGSTIRIPVTALTKDGKVVSATAVQLKWSSSNSKIAAVNSNGKVRALRKGRAVITVTSSSGKHNKITVNVVEKAKKLTKLSVSGYAGTMKAGSSAWLKLKIKPASATIGKINFKSGNATIIAVDSAGRLIALKRGTTKITVTVGNKLQKIKIKVV